MLLVQVTAPVKGGVFDHVLGLKTQWASQGIESHVIELSEALARQRSLADRVDDCRTECRGHCVVILHYSGYAYANRGLCYWLIGELDDLRRRRPSGLHLLLVFHELFASGPPWRTAFWLSQFQSHIASRLAARADSLWTTTALHGDWLRRNTVAAPEVVVCPVFSSIGEPARLPEIDERPARLVVFGSAPTRMRALNGLAAHEDMLRRMGIVEIAEVGGGPPSTRRTTRIPHEFYGRMEPHVLSNLLLDSRYGLIEYASRYMAKSSVFATYASHGCVVLNTCAPHQDTDGLSSGQHYISLSVMTADNAKQMDLVAQSEMAASALRWYHPHRLARQAGELLAMTQRNWHTCN